ncbi:MAG: hypothetical protein ABJF10_01030 [Chthoniobacter sp.]|uniref:hypothetical protein n=1 Tax=Chthoniobacter sp. TaxID=2510640 RepID=UPI0032AB02BA
MKYALLLVACVALPLATFADAFSGSTWKEYVNARFGFKISHPAELVASPDPANGGGREYHTKDKEFSVSVEGHFLNGATLESFWAEDLKKLGSHITYKKKTADWYVVSGVKDGLEFYHKLHVKDGNWAEVSFTYPHAKAKEYDPWVEGIVKSFVPFLQGDYDRIVK